MCIRDSDGGGRRRQPIAGARSGNVAKLEGPLGALRRRGGRMGSFDPYDTLEVSHRASPEVIRAAYAVLTETTDPRRHPRPQRAALAVRQEQLDAAYTLSLIHI